MKPDKEEPRREENNGREILDFLYAEAFSHPRIQDLIQKIRPDAEHFLTVTLPTWLSGVDIEAIVNPEHGEED